MLRRMSRNLRIMAIFSWLDDLKEKDELYDYYLSVRPTEIVVWVDPTNSIHWKQFVFDLQRLMPGVEPDGDQSKYYWSWK